MQCNDCSAKSSVKYHWLGNKCGTCDSFNTNEMQLLGPSTEEASSAVNPLLNRQAEASEDVSLSRPRIPSVSRSRTLPTNLPRVGNTGARSPGSYFLSVEDSTADTSERRASFAQNLPFSPLEMFQRVSRSLSPIRHYLNGSEDEDGDDGDFDAGILVDETDAEVDFWGADGRFLSGEEESDDDDEEDDSSEEEDEGNGDESPEERARGELDDLDELIGHR